MAQKRTAPLSPATRDAGKPPHEPRLAQIASFVDLFVWLMLLKSFFLPLFIIPTGSMAQTLMGAHSRYTCHNCGYEFAVGPMGNRPPENVRCPNCRRIDQFRGGLPMVKAGDRIVVHGWPFDFGGALGPQRWDVVVFKNPNQPSENYIKRLIGLPGDTLELIDGDLFVARDGGPPDIARKTPHAQRALWFPYYDHDYPPLVAGHEGYFPHWASLEEGTPWLDLAQRSFRFDGADAGYAQIQFCAGAPPSRLPAPITDVYGYDGPYTPPSKVTDVRLQATVETSAGSGFVELHISKYYDRYRARLYADGALTLEHAGPDEEAWTIWSSGRVAPPARPTEFALGHADYRVSVEVNGREVLASSDAQLSVSADEARERALLRTMPVVRIGAEKVAAKVSHVLVSRDIHYVSGSPDDGRMFRSPTPPTNGVLGRPITLGDDAYFVCGDNSPASLDSRCWQATIDGEWMLGPHLRDEYQRGEYTIGTVPADQMIGRAFLVYWPGSFMPPSMSGLWLIGDLGRIRWIH